MSDILEEIQALQEQFNNLLGEELEKEGPKGEIKDLSRPPKKDYFDKKIEAAKTNFRTADKVARNNWKKFQASDDTDSSGYSDSYADARTADNEREKALDNYEYTKKEMDAARKGKRIEPKSTMEQIRRIRARRENAIKMNDNNSYNEIVSQIMDLKEAFSNLFEVDDLGQPAMDVPPSQNKIKRDRKTKDGKVELVSVEDELFPYEGNKREQYRQKILDTINNMIQGKATLEDLLQIVRQKKAPLKEAMEILEDIHAMIDKHGDKIGPKSELHDLIRSHQLDAATQYGEEKGKPFGRRWQDEQDFEDRRKGEDTKNYKGQRKTTEKQFKGFGTVTVGAAEPTELEKRIRREHAKKDGKPVQDYPFDGDLEDYTNDGSKSQKIIAKSIARHEKKEQKKAPLKEAIELMEDINNYVRRVHGEPNEVNKSGKLLDKAASIKMREHNKAAGKAAADKLGISMDDEEWWKDENNRKKYQKEFEKQSEEIFKKRKVKNYKTVPNSADFAHGKEWTGEPIQKKAPLKEAIELMEELLLERNKENRDKKEKWELKTNNITKKYKKAIQDYAKQEGDEAKFHRAAAADYDHIYSQQPAKAPDGSPNSVAAYFNGKYQEMLRNKGRNEQNIADEVESLTKKLKNRKHSFHDRVRGWTESEALEEAMEVLEELIKEGRNLEDVVVRGYNKGKVSLDDLQKLMDKAHEVPSDSSYFHKSKGEKGELRTKHRHMDYERNVLSDGWGKDDNKKIEASIKRKAKNDKSFPVFQALKAYKEGKADIKEALEIMEAIINEVSVGALARAVENNLPKRKKNEEAAIKAYKQAQDEYEKSSKESPEDEPALYKKLQCTDKAACKEFDKARDVENLKDLNLPKDSKVSANKLFNAAKKVNPERQKKTEETVKNTKGTKEDAKKFLNSLKRDNRSFDISLADPVKSRNEAN
jgi:hypothetical protein